MNTFMREGSSGYISYFLDSTARLMPSPLASVVNFSPKDLAKPIYQLCGGKFTFMQKPKASRQNNPRQQHITGCLFQKTISKRHFTNGGPTREYSELRFSSYRTESLTSRRS